MDILPWISLFVAIIVSQKAMLANFSLIFILSDAEITLVNEKWLGQLCGRYRVHTHNDCVFINFFHCNFCNRLRDYLGSVKVCDFGS